MKKVLSFLYNGSFYFSYAGSDPVRSVTGVGSNAISYSEASSNMDIMNALLRESVAPAEELTRIPQIVISEINMIDDANTSDRVFLITGTVNLKDGSSYRVSVTKDDTTFTDIEGNAVVVSTPKQVTVKEVDTFVPRSLKLNLGTKRNYAGTVLQQDMKKQQLTVEHVLQSMSDKNLKILQEELNRRFPVEPVVVQPKPELRNKNNNFQKNMSSTQRRQDSSHEAPAQNKESFLATLQPDVARTLQEIPYSLLKECRISTSKEVDRDSIESDGENYCASNNWQLERNFYVIDNVRSMERYFYNRSTAKFTAIPISIIQRWRRLIDE